MQKDSDQPLGAEKHLLAGAIAGRQQTLLLQLVLYLCNFAFKASFMSKGKQ